MPGGISLCYLVPEGRGFRIGRAMLATLEHEAAHRNVAELTLRNAGVGSGSIEGCRIRQLWSSAAGPLRHSPSAMRAERITDT